LERRGFEVDSRVVLITGAAGGVGGALVAAFGNGGWKVAAGIHRSEPRWGCEGVVVVPLDVTDRECCRQAIEQVMERFGRVDCLVNNAGFNRDALLSRMKEEDWDEVVGINLRGAMQCAREVLPYMLRQRDGHIINISSFAALQGTLGQSAYAAAKAGMLGLTQSLAREVGGRNIRVNAVLPGVLHTGMTVALPEERLDAMAGENVLGRLNNLDEVANFIVFLAGMRDVSGQVFQLDSRIGPWT
jgi:3-oxoacyl-[acyl-carrier protein] reductase